MSDNYSFPVLDESSDLQSCLLYVPILFFEGAAFASLQDRVSPESDNNGRVLRCLGQISNPFES